jgi:hypothetical protein
MKKIDHHTAFCPTCHQEHDLNSRKEADSAVKEWRGPGVIALEACKEINPVNPQAAAETVMEMWELITEALPIIDTEANQRETSMYKGKGPYFREMRDLAERFEALISKATTRS